MKKIFFVFVAGFLFLFLVAHACSPLPIMSFEATIKDVDFVFVGKGTGKLGPQEEVDQGYRETSWSEVEVVEPIIGDVMIGQKLKLGGPGTCGYGFSIIPKDSTVLVIADRFTGTPKNFVDLVRVRKGELLGIGNLLVRDDIIYYSVRDGQGISRQNEISLSEFKRLYGGVVQQIKEILVEGRAYTVAELNKNTSITPRKFFTEAYVVMNYRAIPDFDGNIKFNFLKPEIVYAEAQRPPDPVNVLMISDKQGDITNEIRAGRELYPHEIQLNTPHDRYKNLKINQKYRFELIVGKFANIDKNNIGLVSVKNLDGTDIETRQPNAMLETTYAQEGQHYTADYLKNFRAYPESKTIFTVFGFLLRKIDCEQTVWSKQKSCPTLLEISDEYSPDNVGKGVYIYSYDSGLVNNLKVGQRYTFKIQGDKNGYLIISHNIVGSDVVMPVPQDDIPSTKKSFFVRIWNWFTKLFR